MTILKQAIFPVPEFHALACPICQKYKMYPDTDTLGNILGYRCAGVVCGHFISAIMAEAFIGMQMVEE